MTSLIIPSAGSSSRFGLSRPKFLLTHPRGGTMLEASIPSAKSLQNLGVTKIIIPTLETYFQYLSHTKLAERISEKTQIQTDFHLLDNPTSSVVETMLRIIDLVPQEESLIVKDCDNFIGLDGLNLDYDNFVISVDLESNNIVNIMNKSFLKDDTDGNLKRIVEKKVISSKVYVGLVKFESARLFMDGCSSIQTESELYISHVIENLGNHGIKFKTISTSIYEDWGTLRDWLAYCNQYKTIFLDLDGVLLINKHPLSIDGGWEEINFIESNCNYLLPLSAAGKVRIIFTTSRTSEFKDELISALTQKGFSNFDLVMNLSHSKRILVNDFSDTNPYPTALSINLPRDAKNLGDYLKHLLIS
jgi:hypothetical protein